MLIATGMVVGLFESSIPLPVAIPGARLGLSNIVVLVTITVFGYKEGFTVAILKSLLLVLVTGAVTSFAFSFAGTMLSTCSMILAHKYLKKYISLIGISEIGSFFHNMGQVLMASLILQNSKIFVYFPVLVLLGLFTGYFVGIASIFVEKNLKKNIKEFI